VLTERAYADLVRQAEASLAAGRLDEAEQALARIVAEAPRDHRAQHALAVIAVRQGRFEVAVERARAALAHARREPAYLLTLGIACAGAGKTETAADAFRRAVRERPAYPDAWFNLGLALRRMARHDEAAHALRRAAALDPANPTALNELGLTLEATGRRDEAIEAFRAAIAISPRDTDAHNNLGMALRLAGHPEEGAAALRTARTLAPGDARVANNLGLALQALGRLDEARECLAAAADARPEFAEAHANLALVLEMQGALDEAEAAARRAVALAPRAPDFLARLGNALRSRGREADAMEAFERALAVAPEHHDALTGLGLALLALGRGDDALERFERAAATRPDSAAAANNVAVAHRMRGDMARAVEWCRRAIALDPEHGPARSNLLASLNYLPGVPYAEVLAEHRRFGERLEAPLRERWPAHVNARDPERRLRVGYVSGDFRSHAMAFSIAPVLAHHDAARFEVVCYANNAAEDEVTARLRASAPAWHRIAGMSDDAVAELVRTRGIDVLVDLSGHTALNRLGVFARKPAPVQLAWLGYVTSTGLAAMDCRLTDARTDPPGEDEAAHTEALVRLPWVTVFEPAPGSPPVAPLPALAGRAFTFACLNHLSKVNGEVIALWARILAAVPESRLLIGNAGESGVQRRLAEAFAAQSVDAGRLAFRPRMPLADFLALHGEIDLALDTFPYCGGATSCHSLWMGVPFVTRSGDRYMARMGESLLAEVGLEEFVARTDDDYGAIAARAARAPERVAALRATMRDRLSASPLLDGAGFARTLEAAYRAIWRAWCADPAPGFARRARLDAAVLAPPAGGVR
jgi:predicted O-linked N-acetylglucosamine transferase (SPINDLY family)